MNLPILASTIRMGCLDYSTVEQHKGCTRNAQGASHLLQTLEGVTFLPLPAPTG